MNLTNLLFNSLPDSDYNINTQLNIGGNKECRWPKCGIVFPGCCIEPYLQKADSIKKSSAGLDIAKVTHSRGIWSNFDTWVADGGTHYFLHTGNNLWQKINLNDYLGPNSIVTGKDPIHVDIEGAPPVADIEDRKKGNFGLYLIVGGIALAAIAVVLIFWKK